MTPGAGLSNSLTLKFWSVNLTGMVLVERKRQREEHMEATTPATITHHRGEGSHRYIDEATGRQVFMLESMFTVGNPAAAEYAVSVTEPAPEGETRLEATRRTMTEPRFSIPVGGKTWYQKDLDDLAERLLAADPESLPHNYAEKRDFDFLKETR